MFLSCVGGRCPVDSGAGEGALWFKGMAEGTEIVDELEGSDPASAEESDVPWTSGFTQTGSSESTTYSFGWNPGQCTVTALRPHESRHVRGSINAGVSIKCRTVVDNLSAEAKLWERRWWGYDVIAGPNFSDLIRGKTNRVHVSAACRQNRIRVTGFGHYSWGGTHLVSYEVSASADIDC